MGRSPSANECHIVPLTDSKRTSRLRLAFGFCRTRMSVRVDVCKGVTLDGVALDRALLQGETGRDERRRIRRPSGSERLWWGAPNYMGIGGTRPLRRGVSRPVQSGRGAGAYFKEERDAPAGGQRVERKGKSPMAPRRYATLVELPRSTPRT